MMGFEVGLGLVVVAELGMDLVVVGLECVLEVGES